MTPSTARPHRSHGIALVTTLLVILVLSMLAIALFRSSTTQDKNAGSNADHQRALRAAHDALRYGEWLLVQTTPLTDIQTCNTFITLNPGVTPFTCRNPLNTPATPTSWPAGMFYVPAGMQVNAGGGLVPSAGGTPGDVNYALQPVLYIFWMGIDPTNSSNTLYQITAAGFGGRADSVSVVQSVVSVCGN